MIKADKKYRFLLIFFWAVFITDFITNFLIDFEISTFTRVSGITKLVFEFVMIYFIVKEKKYKPKTVIVFTGLLFISFVLSNLNSIVSNPNYLSFSNLYDNVYYLNRYLYIFIFILFVGHKFPSHKYLDHLIKIFKKVLYFNTVLILLGWLFQLNFLKTYPSSLRFGYDGVFSKHGEAAYFYIFFIIILYYEYINYKSATKLLRLIVISCISILIGKKAILFFLALLFIAHFVFILKRIKLFVSTLTGLLITVYFLRHKIIDIIFTVFPIWESLYEKYGFWFAVTSKRSALLISFYEYISTDWNFLNYIFGKGEYELYKVEFELFDVFNFFGLVGLAIYICFFKVYFYKSTNKYSIVLLSCVLITSFFSGALFISVTGMMFFYVVFQWINSSELSSFRK